MMNTNNEILVVEDSLTQALLIQNILEQEGYRVGVARNGVEALNYLEGRKPDLVVSDIVMPKMDGYVSKPVRPAELLEAIDKTLERYGIRELGK